MGIAAVQRARLRRTYRIRTSQCIEERAGLGADLEARRTMALGESPKAGLPKHVSVLLMDGVYA